MIRLSKTWISGTVLLLVLVSIGLSKPGRSIQADNLQAEDLLLYLPLISGDGAGAAQSAIPNGDFEDGRTAWAESSKWGNVLIVEDGALPRGISPHGGGWAAWLGGDNDELAAIEQPVTFDPAQPYLVYWIWLDWPFPCGGDAGAVVTVFLDQNIIQQTDVCETTDTGGWVKQAVDVGGYAGQTAALRFQLATEASSFANFFIDDVSLQPTP